MNKKTIYIILAISLIIIFVIAWFNSPPTQPTPISTVDQIQNFPEEPLNNLSSKVVFTLSAPLPQTPPSLPTFEISSTIISQNKAQEIAQSFGFTTPPKVDQTLEFIAFNWMSPENTILSIKNTPPSFSYTQEVNPTPPPPSPQEAQNFIESFLKEKNLINQNFTLNKLETKYYNHQNLATHPDPAPKNLSNLISINLSYQLNNYPLFLKTKSETDVSLLLSSQNLIKSLSVNIPPNISPSKTLPIIDPNLAFIALQEGKGSLVQINHQNYGEASPGNSFSKVNITKIDLVYFLEKKTNILKPAYRFSGTAQNQLTKLPLTVVYFVTATQENTN